MYQTTEREDKANSHPREHVHLKHNRYIVHQFRLRMQNKQTAEPWSDILTIVKSAVRIKHCTCKSRQNSESQE